jgi:hypothetical protein
MPPRKKGAWIRFRPRTGAAHWEKYVLRIQNALVAVGVIAASVTSVIVFSRTATAKETGLAHAYATDFNK